MAVAPAERRFLMRGKCHAQSEIRMYNIMRYSGENAIFNLLFSGFLCGVSLRSLC